MAVARPRGMSVVECRRAQCARMVYDHTAGRFLALRFCVAVKPAGWCASSARLGWHIWHTLAT